MIYAIGTDIIEIDRVALMAKKDKGRVFTMQEIQYAKNRAQSLAGIFCAKEACIKSLGGKYFLRDIEILHKSNGQPYIENIDGISFNLSISHCKTYATATVIAIKPV